MGGRGWGCKLLIIICLKREAPIHFVSVHSNGVARPIFVSVHSVGVKFTVGAALAQPCGFARGGKLSSIGVL